jgi:hypothetical protein
VRFSPDVEPIVRLVEETPRERCVAAMVEQLRQGLPHRHFLAALYLAAIRAARWHGSGIHGFDHSTYVVHAAHQLALDLPAGLRLLPAFSALDHFKAMQQIYPNRRGLPVLAGALPSAERATEEFHAAMRAWEPDRAERAVVSLARFHGAARVVELLCQYAGRDWGFIGHMAILVASSCRLLETIGWRHAEHVLRYVVQGLAGWGKGHADEPDVRPYRENRTRVDNALARLPGNWAGSGVNRGFTTELLAALRQDGASAACDLAVAQLVAGKAQAGAIWDAVHLAAGELMLDSQIPQPRSQRNGDALHANTAANALHYAFRTSGVPETRLLLTLQAVAWMHMFRQLIRNKNQLDGTIDIARLTGAALPVADAAAIDEILATRTSRPHHAARMAFGLAQRPRAPEQLVRAARELLPLKAGGDPHDIKFPVAIFEDLDLVSPAWRPHVLAAATFSFWGSDRPDNAVMQQVREAVRGLP